MLDKPVYNDEEEPLVNLLYIIPQLRQFAVPLYTLRVDPDNVRKHDKKNMAAIRDSLTRFGQRLPIFAQEGTNVIRAGNGRYQAARELGWSHIACIIHPDAEEIAKAFSLADNRTGELGDWDYEGLARQLAVLSKIDGLLIGWDDADLQPMLRSAWVPDAIDDNLGVHTDAAYDELGLSVNDGVTGKRRTSMQMLGSAEFRSAINAVRAVGGEYRDMKDMEIVRRALRYFLTHAMKKVKVRV